MTSNFFRKSYESTTDDSSDPIYEDFNGFTSSVTPSPSPSLSNGQQSSSFGTTFVELIKRKECQVLSHLKLVRPL